MEFDFHNLRFTRKYQKKKSEEFLRVLGVNTHFLFFYSMGILPINKSAVFISALGYQPFP